MAGKIFVNYRRDDSAAHALNVAQYLEREFGATNVFLDIDRMRAGQKFPIILEERLSVSKVMLAVIGPSWLTVKTEDGHRRLDSPEDWVRLEIVRALARGVPIIPVLVGGASLPKKSELPDDLKPLVDHHVATITTNGFRNEMSGLARDVRDLLGAPPRWPYAAAAVGAAIVAAGLAVYAEIIPSIGRSPLGERNSPAETAARPPDIAIGVEPDRGASASATEDARKVQDAAAAKRKADEAAAAEAKRLAMLQAEEARKRAEADAKRKADAAAAAAAAAGPKIGETFRDCADVCPEMVVVPAGSLTMGSSPSALTKEYGDYFKDEGPQRQVTIAQAFAAGKFEVTWDEWAACVAAGGCDDGPVTKAGGDHGWGKGKRPVIEVDWNDAKAYAAWLSKKTGKGYRLLTEAEWEYAARGGPSAKEGGRLRYWWGDKASHEYGNYGKDQCCGGLKSGKDQWEHTAPVGQFAANPFGLHDLHGNVWEWVQDCYGAYDKNAATASAAPEAADCRRVLRGGSWLNNPRDLRSADRYGLTPSDDRSYVLGFRVARSLP